PAIPGDRAKGGGGREVANAGQQWQGPPACLASVYPAAQARSRFKQLTVMSDARTAEDLLPVNWGANPPPAVRRPSQAPAVSQALRDSTILAGRRTDDSRVPAGVGHGGMARCSPGRRVWSGLPVTWSGRGP